MGLPQQRPVRCRLCPPREPLVPVPPVQYSDLDLLLLFFSHISTTNSNRPTSSSVANNFTFTPALVYPFATCPLLPIPHQESLQVLVIRSAVGYGASVKHRAARSTDSPQTAPRCADNQQCFAYLLLISLPSFSDHRFLGALALMAGISFSRPASTQRYLRLSPKK